MWSVRTTSEVQSDAVNLQEALDALHTFYVTIKDAMAVGWKADLGQVVKRDDQTYGPGTFATVASGATGYTMPQANQIVVSWKTSLAARRGMGRTFFGPLADDNRETDGTIVPSRLTLFKNAAQALITASSSGTNGWAVGVWGLVDPTKETGLPPLTAPHVHRDIIGYGVRDQFAVLRSRRD